jgi:acyl transferase domain-containing protein
LKTKYDVSLSNFSFNFNVRRYGVGHAEGAAGVHSLLAAVVALRGRRAAPVAHLRALSQHVVSAAGGARFLVPLQPAAAVPAAAAAPDARAGCSAFGRARDPINLM